MQQKVRRLSCVDCVIGVKQASRLGFETRRSDLSAPHVVLAGGPGGLRPSKPEANHGLDQPATRTPPKRIMNSDT